MKRPRAVVAAAALTMCLAAAMAPAQDAEPASKPTAYPSPLNVAIVIHDGVELLDFAGPAETFQQAAFITQQGGVPGMNVFLVAPGTEPIVSMDVATIVPEYSIDNCPKPDILLVPGGDTGRLQADKAFMSWFRRTAPDAEIVMSVCTGAFVLAEVGLLDGQEATTHWGAIDGLRNEHPEVTVLDDARYVDNGKTVTTAGISAGIDGTLHVVARVFGKAVADRAARNMEYHWKPVEKYAATYQTLNPRTDERGRQHQKAAMLQQEGKLAEAAEVYEQLAQSDPDDGVAWYRLGLMLHLSGELQRALEVHEKAAEFEAVRSNALYNQACAHALLGQPDAAFEALDKAIDAGFDSLSWMDGDADLQSLRDDPRYKAAQEKLKAED